MKSRISAFVPLLLAAACFGGPGVAPDDPAEVRAFAGDDQDGAAGYLLADTLIAQVLTEQGNPAPNVIVNWVLGDTTGRITPLAETTDSEGKVRATWRLGRSDGQQILSAQVSSLSSGHFDAVARSADLVAAAGTDAIQCGFNTDAVLRCWQAATNGTPAIAPALATADRFRAIAYAAGQWCAAAVNNRLVCFRDTDLLRTGKFAPAQVTPAILTSFGPPFTVLAAAPGYESTLPAWCGITTAKEVWCWGSNNEGRLGDGSGAGTRDLPAKILSAQQFDAVDIGPLTACGIDVTGHAWCWGQNRDGALAQPATVTESRVPIAVTLPLVAVDVAISLANSTCTLMVDGTVNCWGANLNGGLGRGGDGAPSSTPTVIPTSDRYHSLRRAGDGFAAIDFDNLLVLWGGITTPPGVVTPTRIEFTIRFDRFIQGSGADLVCAHPVPGGSRCTSALGMYHAFLATPKAASAGQIYGVPVD